MLPRLHAEARLAASRAARSAMATEQAYDAYTRQLELAALGTSIYRPTNPTHEALASLGIRTERVPRKKE